MKIEYFPLIFHKMSLYIHFLIKILSSFTSSQFRMHHENVFNLDKCCTLLTLDQHRFVRESRSLIG